MSIYKNSHNLKFNFNIDKNKIKSISKICDSRYCFKVFINWYKNNEFSIYLIYK